ncbi:MAG: alginate export family protein, partial [Candidatus Brocadiaceae bacterium]|nr:alginate export family protein [Candidatus Brocadiaceae bacterium]
MKQELRALKAELEALRSEMKSDKDTIKAHDDELLASKQEFSQLSSEVRNWKADPQAVETMKDQIKKELGFIPNVYNEMANKIRLGMELRTRGEYENNWHALVTHLPQAANATGGDGVSTVGRGGGPREDTFEVLNRVRFNIDADVHEHLRAFVQFQDSRYWGWEGKDGQGYVTELVGFGTDNANNRIDIHQGYVDIRKLFNPNLVFRVGRQEIIWGTPGPGDPGHRMLGDFGWSNIGITHDAIRTMWDTERYGAEVFASIVRKYEGATGRTTGGSTNTTNFIRHDDDQNLYGAKFTLKKLIPQGTLELMYLYDDDQQNVTVATEVPVVTGKSRKMKVHDGGFRTVGKVKKAIDYFAEYHYQLGDFRGLSHEAMAGVIGGGYTFDKVAWKPRLGYEFDYSPGNAKPANKKHRTFHNFYPTNHAHYGYADLMSWKNMQAHRFQIKTFPTKKLTAWVDFWTFKLDQGADGWYHAGQGAMPGRGASATNADRTTNLGKEIDLTATYSLYKNVGLMTGYSKFLAGPAARRTDGSNADGDTDWGFLQLTVSF